MLTSRDTEAETSLLPTVWQQLGSRARPLTEQYFFPLWVFGLRIWTVLFYLSWIFLNFLSLWADVFSSFWIFLSPSWAIPCVTCPLSSGHIRTHMFGFLTRPHMPPVPPSFPFFFLCSYFFLHFIFNTSFTVLRLLFCCIQCVFKHVFIFTRGVCEMQIVWYL